MTKHAPPLMGSKLLSIQENRCCVIDGVEMQNHILSLPSGWHCEIPHVPHLHIICIVVCNPCKPRQLIECLLLLRYEIKKSESIDNASDVVSSVSLPAQLACL